MVAGGPFETGINYNNNTINNTIFNDDHQNAITTNSGNHSEPTIKPDLFYAQFRDQSRFWVQRVAVPLIMVIGLFGNLITIIIMTRRRMRSTTNMYLAALAFVDILYLVLTFLLGLSHYPNMDDVKYYYYWELSPFLMMLTDGCSNTSVWLTVTFTVERFIAVRYPMKGKIWCTEQRARMNIIGVFIFGFIAASPVPFEWQIAEKQVIISQQQSALQLQQSNASMLIPSLPLNNEQQLDGANANSIVTMINDYYDTSNHYLQNGLVSMGTDDDKLVHTSNDNNYNHSDAVALDQLIGAGKTTQNSTSRTTPTTVVIRLTLDYSELGRNENYRRIYYQMTAILFVFLPLLSLILFNGFLIKSVHESQRERQRMTAGTNGNNDTNDNLETGGEPLATKINDPAIQSKRSPIACDSTRTTTDFITNKKHQVISIPENNNTVININGSNAPTDQQNKNCDNQTRSPKSSSTFMGRNNHTQNLPQPIDSNDQKIIRKQKQNHRQPSILQRGASILKHNNNNNFSNRSDNLQHHSSSQERRITIMLIAVVILFLVCQIPTAAMLIYRSVHDVIPNTNEDALLLGFGNIFNFLMATNAAGNFILYSFLSKKYRKTFVLLFCNCLKRGNDLTATATSSSISQGKKFNCSATPTKSNHGNSFRNSTLTAV